MDVTYRVTQTKSHKEYPTTNAWAVDREEVTVSPLNTTATRIAKYRKRSTAQAVAAVLEALADQEV